MRKIRNHLGYWLMTIGFHALPPSRYKTELSASLRVLTLRVQATVAAHRAAQTDHAA